MLLNFVEVVHDGSKYTVSKIYVNDESIVSVKENIGMKELFDRKTLDENIFGKDSRFTTLSVAGGQLSSTIIVLGDTDFIYEKVNGAKNVRKTK